MFLRLYTSFLCLTVLQLLLSRRWWVVVVAVEGLLGKVLKGSLSCPWCLSPFQQYSWILVSSKKGQKHRQHYLPKKHPLLPCFQKNWMQLVFVSIFLLVVWNLLINMIYGEGFKSLEKICNVLKNLKPKLTLWHCHLLSCPEQLVDLSFWGSVVILTNIWQFDEFVNHLVSPCNLHNTQSLHTLI